MLKIISGSNKGKKIIFPVRETTRPTSNIVKEAIFDIIQFDILDSSFLDLFSGSGQIGLEALSRGAKHVTFVDHDTICKKYLTQNLKNININNKYEIINTDVNIYLLKCDKIFDIIFLDPPYNSGWVDKILKNITKNISETGTIIAETERSELLLETHGDLKIKKEYYYGRKKLTVYKKNI